MKTEQDYHEAWMLLRNEARLPREFFEWVAGMIDVREEADEGLEPDVETEVICE